VQKLLTSYFLEGGQSHQGYPVLDDAGLLVGVVTRRDLLDEWMHTALSGEPEGAVQAPLITFDLVRREPITAWPWESCRTVAERMAQEGVGRLLVVDPENPRRVVGIVTRSDLLQPRGRQLKEEIERQRFIGPS
jgi:CBS domain-containing protein